MDMLTVDLDPVIAQRGAIPAMGTEVVLWGRSSRGAVLCTDDVALSAQTIAYELVCAVAQRVPVEVERADR